MPTRRTLLASGAAALASPALGASFSGDLADKVAIGHQSGLLTGLHALLVRQGGEALVNFYTPGEDWAWGRDLGVVAHGPDVAHDLRSVTKSIVSLLYGIALDQGIVPDPSALLSASFPEYSDLFAEPQTAAMTVEHALNMTLGLAWNEDLPYTDPRNSEAAMEQAEDRYRYILSQPIEAAPGTQFIYSGGASALVGALIERGTGRRLGDFAQTALFEPLDIVGAEWHEGADGVQSPASGLRLAAPDLAKIGHMLLRDGVWGGAQIVPQAWLARLQTAMITTPFGTDYTHQWYRFSEYVPGTGRVETVLAAMGNGGQRLYVLPGVDLVIVVLAGNYNAPDQWMTPTLVLRRLILQNLRA